VPRSIWNASSNESEDVATNTAGPELQNERLAEMAAARSGAQSNVQRGRRGARGFAAAARAAGWHRGVALLIRAVGERN